jgi:hypothetical protein
MNLKPARRYPTALGVCLCILLVAVVLSLGASESQAKLIAPTATNDLSRNVAEQLVWVRRDSVVINVNGDPLRYEYPDPRFDGSFTQYYVNESAIGKEERFVDHGYEFYDVTIDNAFDRPPLVLNPLLRYKMRGRYAHGGTYNGGGMVGAKLHYYSDLADIEPAVIQGYFPWEPWYDGNATTEWMIGAPTPSQPGQIMKVSAVWIDCPPCNVTWTYEAEPAYQVEQLGAEVVAPVVMYQGEEVAPGEMFFPDTCPLPDDRAGTLCGYPVEVSGRGRVDMKCVHAQQEKLLSILEFIDLSAGDNNARMKQLIAWIVAAKIADNCSYSRREAGGHTLEFAVEQGGAILDNSIEGQSLVIHTPLGTATAATPGTLMAGYDPDDQVAMFRAYSVPLTIQSNTGPATVLQPGQQVRLTPDGFGPVTSLQRVMLPSIIR